MHKTRKEFLIHHYELVLEALQEEVTEKEKVLEVLRKEERHIKQEMEKLR